MYGQCELNPLVLTSVRNETKINVQISNDSFQEKNANTSRVFFKHPTYIPEYAVCFPTHTYDKKKLNLIIKYSKKLIRAGAEEMALWLRAPAALAGDLILFPAPT